MRETANFEDPLEPTPFGEISWLMQRTSWTNHKIQRLCRAGLIPGAMQSQPNTRGSKWTFRKAKTERWLRSLEKK
jgi:hypothetical protein